VRGLPAIALVALVAAAGCGGDGDSSASGERGPADQLRAYLAAFARGDGPAACALMTPAAREGFPELSDQIEAPDCHGAIREVARTSARLRAPRISVHADGERATATITSSRPAYRGEALLEKTGDRWLIAFPPAIFERFKSPPGIPSD
jgi:hypothetical protein